MHSDTHKNFDFRPIRLVVSDLDGTLLNQYNEISQENFDAVMALKEAGILFTFATGRLDCQAKIYIEQLALESPVISCNGALIRSGLEHEIMHLELIDPALAAKMILFADNNGLDYMVYDTDEVFYPPQSERIIAYRNYNAIAERFNSKPCLVTEFDLKRDLEKISERVCKIYLHSEDSNLITASAEYAVKELDLLAVSSMPKNLDIAPPNQTKGNAIHWLAKHYGLQKEEICVFGDNDNDASMMYEAGISFAMQNGSEMAKLAADFMAPSNTVSGVARAIRQFILP